MKCTECHQFISFIETPTILRLMTPMKQKRHVKKVLGSASEATKITCLPIDILTIVCKFLPLTDLKRLQRTDRRFCFIVRTVRWRTLAFKTEAPVHYKWVDGVESCMARGVEEQEALYPLNDHDTKLRFENEVTLRIEKNICVRWADFSEFAFLFERIYANKVDQMIRRIVIDGCSAFRIGALSNLLSIRNMPNLTRVEVRLVSINSEPGNPGIPPSQLVDNLLQNYPNLEVMARLDYVHMCLSQNLQFVNLTVLTLTGLTKHVPTLPSSILRLTLAFNPLTSMLPTITAEVLASKLRVLDNLVDLSIKNVEVTNEGSINWIPRSVRLLDLCCFDRVIYSNAIVRFITGYKMCKDGPQFIFPNLTSLYLVNPFMCPSRRLQTIQWNTWGGAQPFPKLCSFVCSHWTDQWGYIQYVVATSQVDRLSFLEVDTTQMPAISQLSRASEIKYVAIQCRHICRHFKRRLFKELSLLGHIQQVYLVTSSPYCPWFCSRIAEPATLPVDTAYHPSHNVYKVNLRIYRDCNPCYWARKFKQLWIPPEDDDAAEFISLPEYRVLNDR